MNSFLFWVERTRQKKERTKKMTSRWSKFYDDDDQTLPSKPEISLLDLYQAALPDELTKYPGMPWQRYVKSVWDGAFRFDPRKIRMTEQQVTPHYCILHPQSFSPFWLEAFVDKGNGRGTLLHDVAVWLLSKNVKTNAMGGETEMISLAAPNADLTKLSSILDAAGTLLELAKRANIIANYHSLNLAVAPDLVWVGFMVSDALFMLEVNVVTHRVEKLDGVEWMHTIADQVGLLMRRGNQILFPLMHSIKTALQVSKLARQIFLDGRLVPFSPSSTTTTTTSEITCHHLWPFLPECALTTKNSWGYRRFRLLVTDLCTHAWRIPVPEDMANSPLMTTFRPFQEMPSEEDLDKSSLRVFHVNDKKIYVTDPDYELAYYRFDITLDQTLYEILNGCRTRALDRCQHLPDPFSFTIITEKSVSDRYFKPVWRFFTPQPSRREIGRMICS